MAIIYNGGRHYARQMDRPESKLGAIVGVISAAGGGEY